MTRQKNLAPIKGLLGVVLALAVLLTGTMIVTYARYTVSGSAEDEARMAAWGVTVAKTGDLFSDETGELASGTSLTGTIALSGSPEVAVAVCPMTPRSLRATGRVPAP